MKKNYLKKEKKKLVIMKKLTFLKIYIKLVIQKFLIKTEIKILNCLQALSKEDLDSIW